MSRTNLPNDRESGINDSLPFGYPDGGEYLLHRITVGNATSQSVGAGHSVLVLEGLDGVDGDNEQQLFLGFYDIQRTGNYITNVRVIEPDMNSKEAGYQSIMRHLGDDYHCSSDYISASQARHLREVIYADFVETALFLAEAFLALEQANIESLIIDYQNEHAFDQVFSNQGTGMPLENFFRHCEHMRILLTLPHDVEVQREQCVGFMRLVHTGAIRDFLEAHIDSMYQRLSEQADSQGHLHRYAFFGSPGVKWRFVGREEDRDPDEPLNCAQWCRETMEAAGCPVDHIPPKPKPGVFSGLCSLM